VPQLFVRYRDGADARWGRLAGEAPTGRTATVQVSPLPLAASATTADLIAAFSAGLPQDGPAVAISAGDLVSPVTEDAMLICQGLNYADHAAEAQHHTRKQNLFFAKASSALSGAYEAIERPPEVQLLDYEVEFGLVLRRPIGRGGRVTLETIGEYVAGIVLCNDVSARDVMFGAPFLQWFQGKSYRTFCPTGPVLCLLEPAEVAAVLDDLRIELWVNGELRQSAPSSNLIFKPAESLEEIARVLDFKAGDLLLTGTPAGVTNPATPKLVNILKTHLVADELRRDELRVEWATGRPFLKAGDIVTAHLTVAGLGLSLGGQQTPVQDAAGHG